MAKKATDKDRARLRELIEEATVDCYDESEQHVGLLTMIEENVECPFPATVIGEETANRRQRLGSARNGMTKRREVRREIR